MSNQSRARKQASFFFTSVAPGTWCAGSDSAHAPKRLDTSVETAGKSACATSFTSDAVAQALLPAASRLISTRFAVRQTENDRDE